MHDMRRSQVRYDQTIGDRRGAVQGKSHAVPYPQLVALYVPRASGGVRFGLTASPRLFNSLAGRHADDQVQISENHQDQNGARPFVRISSLVRGGTLAILKS
jgi:hypothetical protein